MSMCERLKAHLVLNGLDAVRADEQCAAHLDRCSKCAAVVAAYAEMPALLAELPEHEPSAALVAKTIEGVSSESARPPSRGRRRRIAGGLAAALVAIAALGLYREIPTEWPRARPPASQPTTQQGEGDAVVAERVSVTEGRDENEVVTLNETVGGLGSKDEFRNAEPVRLTVAPKNRSTPPGTMELLKAGQAGEDVAAEPEPEPEPESFDFDGARAFGDREETATTVKKRVPRKPSTPETSEPEYDAGDAARQWAEVDPNAIIGTRGRQRADPASFKGDIPADVAEQMGPKRRSGIEAKEDVIADRPASTVDEISVVAGIEGSSEFGAYRQRGPARSSPPPPGSPAAAFFAEYRRTEGLSFREPAGYWANTYVPGDPAIRLLNARLRAWDRSALSGAEDLEQAVAPVRQPFDPPAGGALGLTVMADANAVEGPTRMRLQVGVRAIDHRRGQRPAMNVGVVVDLPTEAGNEQRIAVRALLDALAKSKQAGDRFSLTATRGGVLVAADEFRFGPLEVAKRALLDPDAESEADPIELERALQTAATAVRQGDDPSRPLGSSSILLITAAELPEGPALDALRDRIHRYAGDGITLSVVPLGAKPAAAAVNALVLAGLGNRRILESPARAAALVENELHAASRAVARAARLSIRLAPGVHLIDVLGSERLDEPAAERVRAIEQSMDLRLSSNLGIQADRGADEDGIQIVIPSVYSGDSLTVLLDVVVERPGPVAEVSLRYKDLVFLNNGALHGQLNLPKGPLDRGPAELAVLKNLLAHHFVLAVEAAADALAGAEPERAAAALERIRAIIAGAREEIPAWRNDAELSRDQGVLENYLQVLSSPEASTHRTGLSDSLRLAAWRKSHRPPPEWQS